MHLIGAFNEYIYLVHLFNWSAYRRHLHIVEKRINPKKIGFLEKSLLGNIVMKLHVKFHRGRLIRELSKVKGDMVERIRRNEASLTHFG